MTKQDNWWKRLMSTIERWVGEPPNRVPLTTSQHILHLLLTIFTAGLWAPVWAIRAYRGNPGPPRYYS